VQLAKWKGAYVIGTASGRNLDFLSFLGVDTVIDYTSAPFENIVHDVDLVVDTVGGDTLERSWSIVKKGGKLLSLVEQPSIENIRRYELKTVKPFTPYSAEDTKMISQTISQMITDRKLMIIISKRFSLETVQQAHKISQQGHGRGRIILKIDDGD
jgi:NADPH:quinone reductase-like Zn-dependent oxidoreductase